MQVQDGIDLHRLRAIDGNPSGRQVHTHAFVPEVHRASPERRENIARGRNSLESPAVAQKFVEHVSVADDAADRQEFQRPFAYTHSSSLRQSVLRIQLTMVMGL